MQQHGYASTSLADLAHACAMEATAPALLVGADGVIFGCPDRQAGTAGSSLHIPQTPWNAPRLAASRRAARSYWTGECPRYWTPDGRRGRGRW